MMTQWHLVIKIKPVHIPMTAVERAKLEDECNA